MKKETDIKDSFLYQTPIAHRGLHGNGIPENSFAAFANAIKEGYAIEMDVRFSKDKQVVVFHDETLLRMTGHPSKVCDLTYRELCALSLAGSGEKIPLFSDFLSFVDGRVPLLIEIKHVGEIPGIVEATVDLLKNYKGDYAVQSFNPLYVRKARKLLPDVFVGQLASKGSKQDFAAAPRLWFVKSFMMQRLMFNFLSKPDFVSYNVDNMPYKRALRYKSAPGKALLCWVVRTKEDYEKIKNLTDNIIFEYIRPRKNEQVAMSN